jgi:nitroimidazol reductase NimA-like FMN-containing flavoprotein (pyridoxamine 5'-phosphate oxidase superfamily)
MAKQRKRSRRPRRGTVKPKIAEFIRRERVCRVATAGSAGMPHLVPVCHVLVRDRIWFASGDDGRKVLNLRENPQIAVTFDIYSDAWSRLCGVMVQGRVRLVERGREFQRIRARLYEKYPQYPHDAALSPSDTTLVEVTPVRVFSWGLD